MPNDFSLWVEGILLLAIVTSNDACHLLETLWGAQFSKAYFLGLTHHPVGTPPFGGLVSPCLNSVSKVLVPSTSLNVRIIIHIEDSIAWLFPHTGHMSAGYTATPPAPIPGGPHNYPVQQSCWSWLGSSHSGMMIFR